MVSVVPGPPEVPIGIPRFESQFADRNLLYISHHLQRQAN
jgi:hypothetical protein